MLLVCIILMIAWTLLFGNMLLMFSKTLKLFLLKQRLLAQHWEILTYYLFHFLSVLEDNDFDLRISKLQGGSSGAQS